MDEMDSLLDSLIEQRNAPEVSYVDEKYASTIKLKKTKPEGQGVFAERPLSVNDPICALGYPTMMAIDSNFLPTICYYCLVLTATPLPLLSYGCTPIVLKICNGCRLARFCNRNCQLKAWHYHKYECKIFKKRQHNPLPAMLRAVLRVVLLKDQDMLQSQEWNCITQLTSHEQILTARGRSNLTDMAEGIKHLAESSMGVEMIQRLIFIMRANATELPTPVHGGIGVMLDPLLAKFNHSCEPNLAMHRPQHTMTSGWMDSALLSANERKTFVQIIPLRDIQEGEELLNCYVVPTVSLAARQATFLEDYFFNCNCTKCLSDTDAARNLANENPDLSVRFEQWTKDEARHISRIGRDSYAFQKATAAMNKSEQYLDSPVLYTTGDFPQIAMRLVLEGLKGQALDEALINVLRLYFLVNPPRFVGRHNPTNTYTIFVMLAIFDALLEVSTLSGISDEQVAKWVSNLSIRGFSKRSLLYWRHRIGADLKKRLEGSAAKDLLILVKEQEEQAHQFTLQCQDAKGEELKKSAEREMRVALRLKEPRWMIILLANGC